MNVTLLTQAHCRLCLDAKTLLERLSREYALTVIEVDLGTAEGQELATGTGVLFAPAILLEGDAIMDGRPSETQLRREIERRLGFCIDGSAPRGFGKVRRGLARRFGFVREGRV